MVSKFAGKRVLIAGGASFIGSHLCELLANQGAKVTVADDLSSGRLENLDAVRSRIHFVEGDLRLPDFARACCRDQQLVFHLAACHGGRGYIETHPVECLGNIVLDQTVFAAARTARAERVVFASSACVYPIALQAGGDRLLSEDDLTPSSASPDGEYGWAKLTSELQLAALRRQHGLSAVSCRIFSAYGERENESHVVTALIAKALLRLDPFPIWGNGSQLRNFTYVGDIARGLALAGTHPDPPAAVNLGAAQGFTIRSLLDQIFEQLGWRPGTIETDPGGWVGVHSRAADPTRARTQLGWEVSTPLAEGLRRTIAWYAALPRLDRAQLERALVEREAGR